MRDTITDKVKEIYAGLTKQPVEIFALDTKKGWEIRYKPPSRAAIYCATVGTYTNAVSFAQLLGDVHVALDEIRSLRS